MIQYIDIQNKKREKIAAQSARPKGKLIVDRHTTLSDEEMRNRMRSATNQTISDSQVGETETHHFLPLEIRMQTRFDFTKNDLFRIPSSKMSRACKVISTHDYNSNIFCQLVAKNMVTKREPDHHFSYLTEMNKMRMERRSEFLEQAKTDEAASSKKKAIKEIEEKRLHRASLMAAKEGQQVDLSGQASVGKRKKSVLQQQTDLLPQGQFDMDTEFAMPFQPPETHDMNLPPQMEDTIIGHDQTTMTEKDTYVLPREAIFERENEYELILIEFLDREKLRESDKRVFLTDVIYKADLTSRCKQTHVVKKRAMFASYLFSAMLSKFCARLVGKY